MSFTLHYHPLSSYCMKALIALYETGMPFTPHLVNLQVPAERAALMAIWPIGKFPVLHDAAAGEVIPEATIIIEYLAHHHPGNTALIPADPDQARATRLRDRFFDLYLHTQMQKLVADKQLPADQRDPHGVAQATAQIETSYALVDDQMRSARWALGEAFTLADCAAAPALFYASKLVPFGDRHAHVTAYLGRLIERPSFARVLAEAAPYLAMFPG